MNPTSNPREVRIAALEKELEDLSNKTTELEEEKEALLLEVQKEAIRQDILEGDLSEEEEKKLHQECRTSEEVEDAREEGRTAAKEVWTHLEVYGAHTAACLSGSLAGSRKVHPLCTCGWNDVATELERR